MAGSKKNAKTIKGWQVAAVVVACFTLAALMVFVPGFEKGLYSFLGITTTNVEAAQQVNTAAKVHIIDVGQGSATLLEQDGEFALLDTGTPEAKDALLGYLDAVGATTLRYLVMTHPHADHIGSMAQILEQYTVEQVILPDFAKAPLPTGSMFQKVLQTIADKNIPAQTAQTGSEYPLGGGKITVLQNGIETADNYNLLSLMMLFEGGGLRVVVTGDAEKENEKALLAAGTDIKADVYVAGHHGSSTSSSKSFVQAVGPAVVCVSCSADNSYGHPHRGPMETFEDAEATVLRTDTDGTVVVGKAADGNLVYAITPAG